MSYAPIYPHGEVEEIGNDIYMVRGSINMKPLVRITRNMAFVRQGNELSLINPIRVDERVLKQITSLGNIKRVIRTGALHGIDDPYYVDSFSAEMWSQAGGSVYTKPKIDVVMGADTALPFDNAQIIEYNHTKEPECALHIADGNGILLTCDAIQNYGDYSYNNLLAKLMMPLIGFSKTTLVGPIWLKLMTSDGGSLESDLRQLLGLKFDRLLSAHGTYLSQGAYLAVEKAIDKAFASA